MRKESIEAKVTRPGEIIAAELGLELVGVEYKKEGADWVLRCFIDSPAGVGIDDCQRYSEAFEKILDRDDPIPGGYLLEVSSPGVERPLRKEADFKRFTGQIIELKLRRAVDGRKSFRGELLGFNELEQSIKMDTGDAIREFPLQEMTRANLSVDLFGTEGGKNKK